jgi:hypothetical protein
MATRNRVIYQSEAIFISPDATGYHYTGAAGEGMNTGYEAGSYLGQTITQGEQSVLRQLSRVQSANYSFTINRQDVNQYGQLGRIDSIILDSPTVSLDCSYYLTDGENERLLGFNVNGVDSCVSGRLLADESEGQNFFILTTKEGEDAIANDLSPNADMSVIALGNGFLSDYSVDLSVGSLPTASVSIEGFNIKSDVGTTGLEIPSISPFDGTRLVDYQNRLYSIPTAVKSTATGVGGAAESALRPGDITLDLADAGLISSQVGGASAKTSAHVQSCSISVPLSRTVLERLGSSFGYTRVVDFPVNASLTINALVADLKTGSLLDRIYEEDTDASSSRFGLAKAHNLSITLKNPTANAALPGGTSTDAMVFTLKNAVLESESFSSSIGSNKSVDLTFSTQIAGPQDLENGVFISGSVASNPGHLGIPPKWTGANADDGVIRLSNNVGTQGEVNYGP